MDKAIDIAANELRFRATIRRRYGNVPPVLGNAGRLSQVFLNLVVNAAHAIGSAGTGRGLIRVRTHVDGDHVVVAVADSGTGIPPEVAKKVFEPFFTTKDVGVGTGQGLALCWSLVVERHDGSIDFETRPGVGTTFTVRLPVHGHDTRAPASSTEMAGSAR